MKNLRSKAVMYCQVLLVAAIMTWPQTATAASSTPAAGVTPGAVEKTLRPEASYGQQKLPEFVVQEEGREMKGDSGVEFKLRWIRFTGNRVISSEELIWLVDSYLDNTISVSDLQKIADDVTSYYREAGYILTRAYVPPQNIDLENGAGKITIVVHEGRLGRVIINGNERYDKNMIRQVVKVLSKEGVISASSIERTLLVLMDYPGMSVRATFVPSVEPGTTNVVIDVTEDKMFAFGIDYNNFGNENVALHRGGLQVSARNLTGVGDALNLRAVLGPDVSGDIIDGGMFYGRAEYIRPIGHNGTRLGLAYSYLQYNLGDELEALDSLGKSHQANIWVSHPFIRARNLSWWVEGGFDFKHTTMDLFGAGGLKLYDDNLLNMRLASHLEYVDKLKGRNVLNVAYHQGLIQDEVTSRLEADSQFSKLEVKYNRFQLLPWRFSASLSGNLQLTPDRLPSAEQIQIGGAGSVRGYAQSEFSGDSGFYGTFELRFTLWDKWGDWFTSKMERSSLQLAGFVDYGKIYITDNYDGELDNHQIAGAGAGIRFAYSPLLQFKVDWAKYIGGEDPIDEEDEKNGIWYVQVSLPY